jgi:hypothetical protein
MTSCPVQKTFSVISKIMISTWRRRTESNLEKIQTSPLRALILRERQAILDKAPRSQRVPVDSEASMLLSMDLAWESSMISTRSTPLPALPSTEGKVLP